MDSIKKFLPRLIRLYRFIFRYLFYVVPFMVLAFVAMRFFGSMITEKTDDQYMILFISIGLTATISGLSFGAYQACTDKDKRKSFYYAGERLFHSVILFAVSIVLSYSGDIIKAAEMSPVLESLIILVLSIPHFLFFLFGLAYTVSALTTLHSILIEGHEKPLD